VRSTSFAGSDLPRINGHVCERRFHLLTEIGGEKARICRDVLGRESMPVDFEDIALALEFLDAGGEAVVCRRTGKVYVHSEFSDIDEFPDAFDDDDDENYVEIPHKRDLGLGKPLVLDFAREFLPDDFDEVRYIFSKRGAYQKFRALVTRRKVLERWYEFESKATERALREWCEFNGIEVAG
jgi:hypothetical protein